MFTRYTRKLEKATLIQKILLIVVCVLVLDYFLNLGIINGLRNLVLPLETFDGESDMTSPEDSQLVCTMYYTNWCPHCKTAKPEWAKVASEYNGKSINGTIITITKVDCEENPDIAKREKVDGFPTFKFKLNDKEMVYSGKREYDAFKQYIDKIVY